MLFSGSPVAGEGMRRALGPGNYRFYCE